MMKEKLEYVVAYLMWVVLLAAGSSGMIYGLLNSLEYPVDRVIAAGLFIIFVGVWGILLLRGSDKKNQELVV